MLAAKEEVSRCSLQSTGNLVTGYAANNASGSVSTASTINNIRTTLGQGVLTRRSVCLHAGSHHFQTCALFFFRKMLKLIFIKLLHLHYSIYYVGVFG